jgi:putative Ca2+/H+ antiporter (TMEM165/GDT1 family)
MNPLIPALIAVFLSEWGGVTQWAVARARTVPVLVTSLLLSAVSIVMAVVLGSLIAPMITTRASSLMLGIALSATGLVMLVGKTNAQVEANTSPILLIARAQFGSYGAFILFAMTALTHQPWLTGLGGLAGTAAAIIIGHVAGLFGLRQARTGLVRRGAGAILTLGGLWAASSTIG